METQNSAMENQRVMASLADRLQNLELDLDDVMTQAGLAHADSLTARSLRKVDSDMALVTEKAFCWPVRSTVEHADMYLATRFHKRANTAKVLAAPTAGALSSKLTAYFLCGRMHSGTTNS